MGDRFRRDSHVLLVLLCLMGCRTGNKVSSPDDVVGDKAENLRKNDDTQIKSDISKDFKNLQRQSAEFVEKKVPQEVAALAEIIVAANPDDMGALLAEPELKSVHEDLLAQKILETGYSENAVTKKDIEDALPKELQQQLNQEIAEMAEEEKQENAAWSRGQIATATILPVLAVVGTIAAGVAIHKKRKKDNSNARQELAKFNPGSGDSSNEAAEFTGDQEDIENTRVVVDAARLLDPSTQELVPVKDLLETKLIKPAQAELVEVLRKFNGDTVKANQLVNEKITEQTWKHVVKNKVKNAANYKSLLTEIKAKVSAWRTGKEQDLFDKNGYLRRVETGGTKNSLQLLVLQAYRIQTNTPNNNGEIKNLTVDDVAKIKVPHFSGQVEAFKQGIGNALRAGMKLTGSGADVDAKQVHQFLNHLNEFGRKVLTYHGRI